MIRSSACPITDSQFKCLQQDATSCSEIVTTRQYIAEFLRDLFNSHPLHTLFGFTCLVYKLLKRLHQRVVSHLIAAECREPDAWLRDDYRLAANTLRFYPRVPKSCI